MPGRSVQRSRTWPSDPEARDQLRRAYCLGNSGDAPDTAVLDACIEYEDEATGVRCVITLVHPDAADAAARRVSVLEPLGMALLGLREGQSVDWPLGNGRRRRVRLVRVLSSADPQAEDR